MAYGGDIDTSVPGTRNYRALIADALARASQTYGSGGSLGQAVGAAAVPLSRAAPPAARGGVGGYNVPGTANYNPNLPATGGDEGSAFGSGGPQYQIDEVTSDPAAYDTIASPSPNDVVAGRGMTNASPADLAVTANTQAAVNAQANAMAPGYPGFTANDLTAQTLADPGYSQQGFQGRGFAATPGLSLAMPGMPDLAVNNPAVNNPAVNNPAVNNPAVTNPDQGLTGPGVGLTADTGIGTGFGGATGDGTSGSTAASAASGLGTTGNATGIEGGPGAPGEGGANTGEGGGGGGGGGGSK